MWTQSALVLWLLRAVLSASIVHCPEETTCSEEGSIEAKSFAFLNDLDTKYYRDVTRLTISNASLDKIPPELKYFKELKYLDLSHNNIEITSIPSLPKLLVLKLQNNNLKSLSFSMLPKNIEELDLSNNLLSRIPQDYTALRALKVLDLSKNLFDCDCYNYNVLTYRKLLKDRIHMPNAVTCEYPVQFSGKNIDTINCTLNDIMVYDEPEEGSGMVDDIFNETLEATPAAPHLQEDDLVEENEFIDDADQLPRDEQTLNVSDVSEAQEEGSGDVEGSGFAPIELHVIPVCHINCSTPEPVGSHDGNDTAPVPAPTDQLKIIAEDVFNPILMEPTPSTTTTTTQTTASSTIREEPFEKEKNIEVFRQSDKDGDVEVFSNQTKTGEMEKATALNPNNYTVYVVVACGLILAAVFIVCLIRKQKAKRIRKNRREINPAGGEEMRPLEKTAITAISEKNGKSSHIPENIPLINGGQNGKHKDEPVLKAYTPLEHPEHSGDSQEDEPELRERLAPPSPRERVTIRASELPDSIPKTPVFVHRQKNSEGEIITTVLPP